MPATSTDQGVQSTPPPSPGAPSLARGVVSPGSTVVLEGTDGINYTFTWIRRDGRARVACDILKTATCHIEGVKGSCPGAEIHADFIACQGLMTVVTGIHPFKVIPRHCYLDGSEIF